MKRGIALKRDWIHGWLLLLPAMVFLFAFTHIPAVTTFLNSFFSTPRGRRPAKFIGLSNYERMLDDPVFWKVLWNNAWFAFGTIPVSVGLAIVMALWSTTGWLAEASCAWPISRRPFCL